MKRSTLVLAIAACAAIASPSTASARLSDLMETRQAQPNYAYYNPYTYGGYYRPYSYGGYYRPY